MQSQSLPVPDVLVFTIDDNQIVSQRPLTDVISRNTVLVGVPGCFTPTCTRMHLPGFVRHRDAFARCGLAIAFASVNDPFVLSAWLKSADAAGVVTPVADPGLDLTTALKLKLDLSRLGMQSRSKRYCAVIREQQIVSLFVDEHKLENTAAEAVLDSLSTRGS